MPKEIDRLITNRKESEKRLSFVISLEPGDGPIQNHTVAWFSDERVLFLNKIELRRDEVGEFVKWLTDLYVEDQHA